MIIQGLQKLTLLDYPGKLAATVFLGGCNFRCPFCHNSSLVLSPGASGVMSEESVINFLAERRPKLTAVCISGGEPTMNADLPSFIYRIKELGFSVKLDTNGTSPEMLYALTADELIDYVAMDIKSSKAGYALAAGKPNIDISAVEESVAYLLTGSVDYEFRTTLVRGIHTDADMIGIGEWIRGAKRYFLQGYKNSGEIISPEGLSAFSKEEMTAMLSLVKPYVESVALRG
jgi:pyruvate formate lyase activating enzyme